MSALPKTIGPAVSIGNVAVVNAPELEQFQAFQGEIDYNFRHLSELHQKEVLKMIYQRLERITDLEERRFEWEWWTPEIKERISKMA